MKHLLVIALTIFSLICLSCCDDKDKEDIQGTECECDVGVACPDGNKDNCPKTEVADKNKCDPACTDGKECKCTEDKCECAELTPTNECDGKSAGDECLEGKTCQDDNGTLACKDKPAAATICNPTCDAEKQDCVCEADKCECKDKNAAEPEDPCKDKDENADCGENKTCQKGDGDKLECKDKPAGEPTQPDPAK